MSYSIGRPPSRRKRVVKENVVADFEATTDPDDCRVWGWGFAFVDYPDDVEIDKTIDQFIVRISDINSICYFHNLRYDGRFILDWLLKNGYSHDASDDRTINKWHFKTLISDMGRFYSITVCWENGNVTEFRDSLNKIPLPIADIAVMYQLGETKGDIDYTAERPIGHDITAEERDYIRRDVSILAKAVGLVLKNGMTQLTVGSDSMKQYKHVMGKNYNRLFPILSDDMDAEIRRAYRGGWTYRDKRRNGMQRSGIVLDVNSLYPSVMKYSLIPYGEPVFCDGKVETNELYPLSIFSITFTAKLKKDHLPCLQIKGSTIFTATEYLEEVREPTTVMMTNVDFALYSDHYDIRILEFGGGWLFKAAVGMFDAYIDKWAKIKEESTGGEREIAKLFLNSLYGKFATNPNVSSKIPVLDENGVVKLVQGEDGKRTPVYTAAGVFITSHARNLTIRAAQANYDTFAYADTDSLHLLRDDVPADLDVHASRMGAWKFEYAFDSAYYVRAKAYMERHAKTCLCKECKLADGDEVFTNRIAGLPERISSTLRFDIIDKVESEDGMVIDGKLKPMAVPGGIVLVDTPYRLKL